MPFDPSKLETYRTPTITFDEKKLEGFKATSRFDPTALDRYRMYPLIQDVERPLPLQDLAKIATITPPAEILDAKYFTPLTKWVKRPLAEIAGGLERQLVWAPSEWALRKVKQVGKLSEKWIESIRKIYPTTPEIAEAEKRFRDKTFGWLDRQIEMHGQPEKYGLITPYQTEVRSQYTLDAMQRGTAARILDTLGNASTDAAIYIGQLVLMKRVSPPTSITRLGMLGQHLARIGVHGYLTTRGNDADRLQSAFTRIAYNMTPFIVNATGLTGLTAVAVDGLFLNTFLTSPTYVEAYKRAEGINTEFLIMALPQFMMDMAMAWNTRGLPENVMMKRWDTYLKGRIKSLKIPRDEAHKLLETMQENMDLDTGKPTQVTVQRIVKKTISKYPEPIVDQTSLERVGNAVAKDIGVPQPIDWVWKESRQLGITGLSGTRVTLEKDPPIRSQIIIRKGPEIRPVDFESYVNYYMKKGKIKDALTGEIIRLPTREKARQALRNILSLSQGKIKKVVVHELIHRLPEVRKERVYRKAHPKIFYEKYGEETKKLFTEKEIIIEEVETRLETEPELAPVNPRDNPPKPPPPREDSPGITPDEPTPSNVRLTPLPKWKASLLTLYKIIDVEASWKAIGAPETGFHIKNYFSRQGASEDYGLSMIRRMTRKQKLTPAEWARMTYYNAQPKLMAELGKEEFPKWRDTSEMITRDVWKYYERKARAAKIFVEPWPQSQITRLREGQAHDKANIKSTLESKMPEGLKDYRVSELKKSMIEADEAISFLEKEMIGYVHIPTRLWLEKLFDKDVVAARKIISRYFRERKTIDIKELAEHLKELGLITDKDIDIRSIVAAYSQKMGRLLALSNIINAAKKEGLIVEPDVRPDWPYFSRRLAPELKGSRVHPAFREFLDEFSTRTKAAPLGRVFSYFKIAQFYNPLFLPCYDLVQSAWLGSVRSIKTPLYAWKAIKSMAMKDSDYMDAMENGLASQPFTARFADFMKSVEMAKASNNFLKYGLTFLQQNWKIPTDMIYKPIWHMAWGGDRLVRLMSYHYLRDKKFTPRQAAQTAALFHSDYASVPTATRHVLNRIFFTPIFPITMGKLQANMIASTGKVLGRAATLRLPKARDAALASGLLALAGMVVVEDIIMSQLGYEKDILGYRYTKKIIDERGNEREIVVSLPSPHNVLLRWYHGFKDLPVTGDEMRRYLLRASWRLHPIWRTAVMMGYNTREDMKTPIYNPFADPSTIAWERMKFASAQLIGILRKIDELPGSKSEKRLAREAFRDDVGRLWYTALAPTVYVYMRKPKSKRDRGKMIHLMKTFAEFMVKKPLKGEEKKRARERLKREMRGEPTTLGERLREFEKALRGIVEP